MEKFYLDNETFYINDFADFMKKQVDDEYSTEEIKEMFKYFMFDYKNIKVDYRFKFWKSVINKALIKAGFNHYQIRGE